MLMKSTTLSAYSQVHTRAAVEVASAQAAKRDRFRRFGAKPDKKIVDRSSGEPEFMEDAFHCNSDGLVVGVDRFWVVRPAC